MVKYRIKEMASGQYRVEESRFFIWEFEGVYSSINAARVGIKSKKATIKSRKADNKVIKIHKG